MVAAAALLVLAAALVVAAPLAVALAEDAALLVAGALVAGAALLVAADPALLLVLAVTAALPPQAAKRLAAPAAMATRPIDRSAFRRDNTPPITEPSEAVKRSCTVLTSSFHCDKLTASLPLMASFATSLPDGDGGDCAATIVGSTTSV